MKPIQTASVKSADRALDILEYVADAAEPPSFSQMLDGLGIPRSSLFHLLNNLLARRYLEQDASTERYRLGESVRILSRKISAPPLSIVVVPILKRLTGELNETSGFYVRVDNEIEAIASVTSNQALAYTMRVGERAPLYAVSGGKIALAQMPASDLETYLRTVKLEAITPNTITSKRRLKEELFEIRERGFAYSHEEFTPGIVGIAVPVELDGRLIGALNLAVPAVRFTEDRNGLFRRQLANAAATLVQAIIART